MNASEPAGDSGEHETRSEAGGGEDARTPERSVLADPVSDVTESVPVRAAQEAALGDAEETDNERPAGIANAG